MDNYQQLQKWIQQLLNYSKYYSYAGIYLSNGNSDLFGNYELIAGFSNHSVVKTYEQFKKNNWGQDLWLGLVGFDVKNHIEKLESKNPCIFNTPELCFFKATEFFLLDKKGNIETNLDLEEIDFIAFKKSGIKNVKIAHQVSPIEYKENIEKIKRHIVNGDFYEMNYCVQFFSESISGLNETDLISLFWEFNQKTQNPFACYLKLEENYLLSSSPERFLQKKNTTLISQPIKGTRRRGKNMEQDMELARELNQSEKDRAENIMIVDLVRNDLGRICKAGTVEVKELCKLYSYNYVHHLISTISGELKDKDIALSEIFSATFPMGSMTGAPKIEVLKTIEELENFKRNWYSGSAGYIFGKNFDFNVVIRSILANTREKRLAFHAGGAITYDSDADKEYQEVLTKAASMIDLLKN